jgi:hypothetical protein
VCAAADADFLSLGSTPFLRWMSFQSLSALGYTGNDLTDATLNDVTRFKSQLGGDLVTNWLVSRPQTFRYRIYRKAESVIERGRAIFRRLSPSRDDSL